MDAYIFRFTAKQLKSINSDVLGFLIASGHCCNELATLMPYVVFEHSLGNANEVEAAFILTRRYTIARIMISKIVEYDELCRNHFAKIGQASAPLLKALSLSYEPIGNKIRSEKWARILRNKASFHYDGKHAVESLMHLDDGHPLQLIAGPIKGLTLFQFSEEIVSRPIFEAAGGGHIGKGMGVSDRFVVDLIGLIPSFHAKATIAAFTEFGLVTQRDKTELRERYCAAPGKVFVPLSISSAYIKSHERLRSKRVKLSKRKRT